MSLPKTHTSAIAVSLEAKIIFTLDCSFCQESVTFEANYGDDDRLSTVAGYFMKEGWRQAISEHYGCIGLACPCCQDNGPERDGKGDLKPYLGP
jgi:hypothetical protein